MPIYEYQCIRCGHRVEQISRLDDPPLTVCEECGGELKKMVSAPAFQFKGTGWYVTDYAGKKSGSESKDAKDANSAKDSGKESKAAGDGAAGSASGTESKGGESKSSDGGGAASPAPAPSKPAASE